MNGVDSILRFRDKLLLRRLMLLAFSGGNMIPPKRRAVLRGLTDVVCHPETENSPASRPAAVSISIANATINIFCDKPAEITAPQTSE